MLDTICMENDKIWISDLTLKSCETAILAISVFNQFNELYDLMPLLINYVKKLQNNWKKLVSKLTEHKKISKIYKCRCTSIIAGLFFITIIFSYF